MLAKFAIRNLARNRRRTVAAIGTIGIGVFGLLFLEGFFSGLLAMHAENSVHSRNGHGQVMTKGYWGQAFEKPMDHWIEEPSKILDHLRAQPEVIDAFPRTQFYALLTNGSVNVSGKGMGIDAPREKVFFDRMNYVAGGPIGDTTDGIVLGIGLARAIDAKVGDRVTVIGQTIHGTVNAIDTTVTGIFHIGFKEADDVLFQVPIQKAHVLLDTSKVESIAVGIKNEDHWSKIAVSVGTLFPQTEALSVYVIDQVWAENGRLFLTALLNLFRLIFLGVMLLAIYNAAANTVLERKREIGMLRANGESTGDVIRLLTLEGLAIAVLGALLGGIVLFGVDLLSGSGLVMPPTPGTNRALPIKLHFEPMYVAITLSLGMGTPVLATFLATLQVTRMSVVKALRTAA